MKLFFAFLVSSLGVVAQETWHPGGVAVLHDNQVISGEVMFYADLLLMKSEGRVAVYPAHQVASFRFYDAEEKINRHYRSLPVTTPVFSVSRYFEVVIWGEVSIIRRENFPLSASGKGADDYTYFTWYENEMIDLRKFKARLFPLLAGIHSLRIKEFMEQEKLNPNNMADAIRIVKFCNQQAQARISMAAL